MNLNAMLVAGLVVLPAMGLVTWAWLAMAQVEDELRAFSGFEGMDFDI